MSELPEWAESLPEQLHDAPHLKGSESADQWLDHIKNDSAWRGQSVRIPSEDADDTVIQEFKSKLLEKTPDGLFNMSPAEAADYNLPEGVELDNADDFKEVAHSLGLTQKAFRDLIELRSMDESGRNDQAKANLDQGYESLKGEWGAAYEQNYTQVADVMRNAPESIRVAYENNAIPAEQIKWLHSLAELAAEPQEVGGQAGRGVMTPEQATLELEEIKPKFYAMKKHDPGYAVMQAKVERLIKLRMGQAA